MVLHTDDTRVSLGASIAMPADLDGNGGARDLAVGAPGYHLLPDGGWIDDLGQVYVYDLDDLDAGPWATIHPHTSLEMTAFGHQVCAVDSEGDGISGILASARRGPTSLASLTCGTGR